MSRGKKQEITCICGCNRKRPVRVADIKRGWGKYYSKSCKAVKQENRTGQYAAYLNRPRPRRITDDDFFEETSAFGDPDALGQWND